MVILLYTVVCFVLIKIKCIFVLEKKNIYVVAVMLTITNPPDINKSWPANTEGNDQMPRVKCGAYSIWDSEGLVQDGLLGSCITAPDMCRAGHR